MKRWFLPFVIVLAGASISCGDKPGSWAPWKNVVYQGQGPGNKRAVGNLTHAPVAGKDFSRKVCFEPEEPFEFKSLKVTVKNKDGSSAVFAAPAGTNCVEVTLTAESDSATAEIVVQEGTQESTLSVSMRPE